MPCQVRPGVHVVRPVLTTDKDVFFLYLRLFQGGVDSAPLGSIIDSIPGIGYGSLNL